MIRGCPDYYFGHTNDAVKEGRLLEVEPFDARTLGEWQERVRVSPVVPYGMTHPDMMEPGGSANMAKWDFALMGERLANDIRCLGAGLAASFVKGSLASLASTLRLPSVRQALKTTQLSLSSRRSIKSGTVGFARAPITEIARMASNFTCRSPCLSIRLRN